MSGPRWEVLQGEGENTEAWGHLIERLTGDLHSLLWSNFDTPSERAAARAVLERAWAGGFINSWSDLAGVFAELEGVGTGERAG